MEVMELENARLEEEMQNVEPHVFSTEFEQKMEEVMQIQKKINKFFRSIAIFVMIAVIM